MSRRDDDASRSSGDESGAWTAEEGTPVAVDVSRDVRARSIWAVFLAGPVIWFVHFVLVYMAVEVGCNGSGPGLRLLDARAAALVTLVATGVAALACLGAAAWGYRWWRRPGSTEAGGGDTAGAEGRGSNTSDGGDSDDPRRALAFAGFLLSLLSLLSVLVVGLPALALQTC